VRGGDAGEEARDSRKLASRTGKIRYLQRILDTGTAPYRHEAAPRKLVSPAVNRYVPISPSDSRADVEAAGAWSGGY